MLCHPAAHCTATTVTHCYCATTIAVSHCCHRHSWQLLLCCCCGPAIHCTATVDANWDHATAVAISHCDTRHCPLPPPLPILIALPSHCPLRCRHCHPSQLHCRYATLCHLLMRCCPSTCQLVVTLDWLSLHHLLSCHHLSMRQLVITLPLYAPHSSLPWLVVASPYRCHCLSTCRLIVTSPLIRPPSCLPCPNVPAPLVAPLPLIALAGCHVASHHATHLTWLVVVSPLVTTNITHLN